MEAPNRYNAARGGIAGIVSVVPKRIVRNEDMRHPEHANDAGLLTGVVERRHIREGIDSLHSMAKTAAAQVMGRLGWRPESIDLLLVVTQTPEQAVPADVFGIKASLGLPKRCVALQINQSCSGYVYGLWLAMALLQQQANPQARAILVVGDVSSRIMDPCDRATAPLFGDAVSATGVTAMGPLQHFLLGSDGTALGGLHQGLGEYLHMDGAAVFNFTLREVKPMISDVLSLPGWRPEAILFHQANAFMLKHLLKHVDAVLPGPRPLVPTNIERFGNCSSASIPLLMCTEMGRAAFAGKMLPVAMFGFGAGWAWGGARIDCVGLEVADLVEV